jgi:hypothetical protein
MLSRQERRKNERDAAKRAPRAGTAGAAGATAALADLIVNPLGDWRTQAERPMALLEALGSEIVKRRAREGDGEAQRSLGYRLLSDTGVVGEPLGSAGRSLQADVGHHFGPTTFSGRSQDRDASMWSLSDDQMIILP